MPRRELPAFLYHATPLHYAPYALATGVLYSQARLAELELPVRPRPTAARRDRKLRLDGYVHLSLTASSPLLRDKLARGYPHVLFSFPFASVMALPGVALERYNAKAWRHRDDFAPVTDDHGKAALLAEWQAGRYPSAEVLVPASLPLGLAAGVHAATEAEAAWLSALCTAVGLASGPTVAVSPALFGTALAPFCWAPFEVYAAACRDAGKVLAPPRLPFD